MTSAEKELINRLYDKYYAKKRKNQKGELAMAMKNHSKESSRNDLMLRAKAKGVKNFRILNKQELIEILQKDATQDQINEIVTQAIARWKAGWGKRGGQPAGSTKATSHSKPKKQKAVTS